MERIGESHGQNKKFHEVYGGRDRIICDELNRPNYAFGTGAKAYNYEDTPGGRVSMDNWEDNADGMGGGAGLPATGGFQYCWLEDQRY